MKECNRERSVVERKTAYNLVVELERILNEQLKLMDEKENAQSLDVINVLNQRIELLEIRRIEIINLLKKTK